MRKRWTTHTGSHAYARMMLAVLLVFSVTGLTHTGQPVWPARAAGNPVNTVVVDPNSVVRTIPPNFFGANYVAFWDTAQGSAASAKALAQTPIKTLRFAGGDPGDWYDWQDPYYQGWSTTSPMDLWNYGKQFGAAPLFQTNVQGNVPNPPGQSYAVNSPQNAAAWVAYNKQNGIPAMMEVGNEEDGNQGETVTHDPKFQPYIDTFNAQARAMHQADPNVKVIGPAGMNEWYWWGLDSLGMFLGQTGNKTGTGQVDGVSLHLYWQVSTWQQAYNLAQTWNAPGRDWPFIQSTIQANDTRPLPVYITEWNVGPSDSGNTFNPTLGHGLVVADTLGAFAQSGVAGEDYFEIHGQTGWGLLCGVGDGCPLDSPTPAYYATVLWGKMGNQILASQQSADAGTQMSTYATKSSDGSIQLMAINKQATTQTVQLQLNGTTPAGHDVQVYSMTPQSPTSTSYLDQSVSYNGQAMPSPQSPLPGPRDLGNASGSTVSYDVPPYSAVVLTVRGTSPTPTLTATSTPNPVWTATPTNTPPAALNVTATGSASPARVAPGGQEQLQATITSNQAIGQAMVDYEVYDSSSNKVFQQTQNITLNANSPVTVSQAWAVPATQATGTYTYKIGVFGTTWSPLYTWNDAAGTFTIGAGAATQTATATSTRTPPAATGTNTPVPPTSTKTNTPIPPTATRTNTAVPPTSTATPMPPTATGTSTPVPPTATKTNTPVPPTATATASGGSTFTQSTTVSPAQIARQGSTTIKATVRASKGSLANGIVDIEVYNQSWAKVGQRYFSAQSIATGTSRSYSYSWTAPASAGTYTVMVGVFGPNWTPTYYWSSNAATIAVK